jgi:hypothetical protein
VKGLSAVSWSAPAPPGAPNHLTGVTSLILSVVRLDENPVVGTGRAGKDVPAVEGGWMMVGVGPGNQAMGVTTNAWQERVARRTAELYANDAEVRDTRPRKDIAAAVLQPGMRLSQIVAMVMGGYADRPALGSVSMNW